MLLENYYYTLLGRLESALSGRYWLWKLTFFSVALSLFLAFPPYHLLWNHLNGTGHLDAWIFIEKQGNNLLSPGDIGADARRENMIFRWTLPLLSFLTGHNLPLILLLQAVLGVWFIYWIGKYISSLTGDKITTALSVLSVSHIFVGVWHFAEVHGYGDGIGYFSILAAMLLPGLPASFLLFLAACFTDERAVLAGGYIILWNVVRTAYKTDRFDLKSLFLSTFLHRNSIIWLAWVVYFSARLYVRAHYFADHVYSTLGSPVLFENAHRNGLGSSIWGVFEGTWLLLLSAGLVIWLSKKYWLGLMLLAGFTVLLISGIYVHDIDRSLSYGFPFLLISLFILHQTTSPPTLHLLLFFTAVVCIIHPQLFYMGYNKILWLEPFPMKIAQFLDNVFGWHFFR